MFGNVMRDYDIELFQLEAQRSNLKKSELLLNEELNSVRICANAVISRSNAAERVIHAYERAGMSTNYRKALEKWKEEVEKCNAIIAQEFSEQPLPSSK